MISKRLKAAAGPNPDPEGSDEEPDSDLELIQVPAISEVTLRTLLKFPSLHFSFKVPGSSSYITTIHR